MPISLLGLDSEMRVVIVRSCRHSLSYHRLIILARVKSQLVEVDWSSDCACACTSIQSFHLLLTAHLFVFLDSLAAHFVSITYKVKQVDVREDARGVSRGQVDSCRHVTAIKSQPFLTT